MIYELIVGDDSGDGHEKTVSFIYDISITNKQQLEQYYKDGCQKLGIEPYCDDYEDYTFCEKNVQALKNAGFDFSQLDDSHEVEGLGFICLAPYDIPIIYLFIAWIGSNKTLEYKVIPYESIGIGGYGLFSS